MKTFPTQLVLNFSFWIGLLLFGESVTGYAQTFQQDSLKLISKDFEFTEGPAANKKGDIFFTDQPNNKIWKYSTQGQLSLFSANAGRANGLYFDAKGNLIACADEQNELWSFSPDGSTKVIAGKYQGRLLNGPNDLWIDPKGGIYITDPYYQRTYWSRTKSELDGQKVYYLPPGKNKQFILVADDMVKPNGIIGSPDGRYLYVADIQQNKIFRYTIAKNGSLSEQKAVVNQGADGITLDRLGNLYLSGKGVFIFSPNGSPLGHIEINEPWTANLCFGGTNGDQLFITASKAIYTIPIKFKEIK